MLKDYSAPMRQLLHSNRPGGFLAREPIAYTLKSDQLSFLYRHAGSVRQLHVHVYI